MSISQPQQSPPLTRRTRFVCISDTHNTNVKLPKGHVLIHAGDLTNMGRYSELKNALAWLDKADFECKIVVAGNHDMSLDRDCHARWLSSDGQTHKECREMVAQATTLTYLEHEARNIKLSSPGGPHTTFNVFASPLSPQFGHWAFMYERSKGVEIWDAIPLDTDVLITHCPPRGLFDFVPTVNEDTGCSGLLQALWRVRPKLSVFGHIHEGRGAARVKWDLDSVSAGEEGYRIKSVIPWQDPAPDGGKNSLCDLTGKSQGPKLDNDGSAGEASSAGKAPMAGTWRTKWVANARAPIRGTRGMGGDPSSSEADQLSLSGRLGRRETCVVNAAIMAASYHGRTHITLNKPIVVDLDLPVWKE